VSIYELRVVRGGGAFMPSWAVGGPGNEMAMKL
jgi:hypothetical protein